MKVFRRLGILHLKVYDIAKYWYLNIFEILLIRTIKNILRSVVCVFFFLGGGGRGGVVGNLFMPVVDNWLPKIFIFCAKVMEIVSRNIFIFTAISFEPY